MTACDICMRYGDTNQADTRYRNTSTCGLDLCAEHQRQWDKRISDLMLFMTASGVDGVAGNKSITFDAIGPLTKEAV